MGVGVEDRHGDLLEPAPCGGSQLQRWTEQSLGSAEGISSPPAAPPRGGAQGEIRIPGAGRGFGEP